MSVSLEMTATKSARRSSKYKFRVEFHFQSKWRRKKKKLKEDKKYLINPKKIPPWAKRKSKQQMMVHTRFFFITIFENARGKAHIYSHEVHISWIFFFGFHGTIGKCVHTEEKK